MIRVNRLFTTVSEELIFSQCLDNDVINLCCGRRSYSAVSPIYMSNDRLEPFNTIISHLKGARTLSVWEDLTVCDFLDIIDS